MNTEAQVFVRTYVFNSRMYIPLGMELLGDMISLCLTFLVTANFFSRTSAPLYILVNTNEGSNFSTFESTFVIVHLDYSHPGACKRKLHCAFDLHSPTTNHAEHLFTFIGHLTVFFGEMCIRVLRHFLIGLPFNC